MLARNKTKESRHKNEKTINRIFFFNKNGKSRNIIKATTL